MTGRPLKRTLAALVTVARGGGSDDALVENLRRFVAALEAAGPSSEAVAALAREVEAWLAQMVGPLLGQIAAVLEREPCDLASVREVLRALWVILGTGTSDAQLELLETGALLGECLGREDRRGVRQAVEAARGWWARHQWTVSARLKGGAGG